MPKPSILLIRTNYDWDSEFVTDPAIRAHAIACHGTLPRYRILGEDFHTHGGDVLEQRVQQWRPGGLFPCVELGPNRSYIRLTKGREFTEGAHAAVTISDYDSLRNALTYRALRDPKNGQAHIPTIIDFESNEGKYDDLLSLLAQDSSVTFRGTVQVRHARKAFFAPAVYAPYGVDPRQTRAQHALERASPPPKPELSAQREPEQKDTKPTRQTGPAPYGYRRATNGSEGSRFVPDEKEAPIVQMIFREYLRKRSMKRVLAHLEEQGLRTRRGCPWSRAALAWILKNDTYLGKIHAGEQTRRGGHEPIIAPIIFNKVGRLLAKNDKRSARIESVSELSDAVMDPEATVPDAVFESDVF